MVRNYTTLLIFPIFVFLSLFATNSAEANSSVSGTFVNVTYEDVYIDKNVTEKRLKNITIKNEQGRTITLNIDKFAKLSVDTLTTKISAFKLGMEVEADVNLRRVKALRGKTGAVSGSIEYADKTVIGSINRIDKSGSSISVRLDSGQTKTYYLNEKTEMFKGTTLSDLSLLYEGDRVKVLFSKYNTNLIDSIEVIVQGIKVESLYKGTIQRIDPSNNKLIIRDELIFRNWEWYPSKLDSNSSYSYSSKIPIYVGDELIKPERLRYYANNDVYFTTTLKFGEEIIEKMVIKKNYERTYYEEMTSVNTASKRIGLQNAGSIRYHDGTILIRNGRLVDPNSLLSSGRAFVVTDGSNTNNYANVVHITNDGFQSPNLVNHSLYYGKINSTKSYTVTLSEALKLTNNQWESVSSPTFSFSNDTAAVRDYDRSVLTVVAKDEMIDNISKYGYFYVENNTVVAVHFLAKHTPIASIVSVGRFDGINSKDPYNIRIRNVSQWQSPWTESPFISSMNIKQATLIKDGKVIPANHLKQGDRIYLLHESSVKGRILLVN